MGKEVVTLLEILEQRNSYLLEFHKINVNEMDRLNEGCIDNFENFYYSREILLNAIDRIDNKLSRYNDVQANPEEKKKLEEILRMKRDMTSSILDQDLVIMSLVEELKNKHPSIAS